VLIRELPLDLVRQPEQWRLHDSATNTNGWVAPEEGVNYPANEMLDAAGGAVTLGKPAAFPSFGWDNEYVRPSLRFLFGFSLVFLYIFSSTHTTLGPFLDAFHSCAPPHTRSWPCSGRVLVGC